VGGWDIDPPFLRAVRGSFSTGALSADMVTAFVFYFKETKRIVETWREKDG
jgi:hypothetical protein